MTKTPKPFDFRSKSAELDKLLERLQDPTIQVDEASELYQLGRRLIAELEDYLEHAENVVKRLSADTK